MAHTIDVQILGKGFSFQLSEDVSPQEFASLVEYVEKKLKKIKRKIGETDSFRLGLLAAINIAQDMHALKAENEKLRQVFDRIDSLLEPQEEKEGLAIRFTPKKGESR